MPVYSRTRTNPISDYFASYTRTGEVTHEGLVLEIYRTTERVMSDVWADFSHARIWDPHTRSPSSIYLSNSEFGGDKEAEVDATPEVVAAWEAWKAEELVKARRLAHEAACDQAHKRLLVPSIGHNARVVRGRKVPVGTEGVVTWAGPSTFGPRVGLRDTTGATHYTAASNVERVGIDPLPGEDWLDVEARLANATQPPTKWDRVRLTDGREGTVFYVNGHRVGITLSMRKVDGRFADVVWGVSSDVSVLEHRDAEPTWTVDTPQEDPESCPF